MAFIETIEPGDAHGELKDIYADLLKSRGKIAEVHKIQSLNPPTIVHHMELYMSIMYGKSPIKRVLREILGVIVSMANQCEYCTEHHAVAVDHYWKDSDRIERLKRDFHQANLTEGELVLCDYARDLTLNPGNSQDGKWVYKLQGAGYGDREILDATLVCSYFNFVNRMVLSLGATSSKEEVGGYKYDSQE